MSNSQFTQGQPWAPSNASPAVRGPDSDTTTDGKDAIREGKQHAKQTMAAAGLDPIASPALRQQSNTPNGSGHANGTPTLSRKRSRDGTQLPLAQATVSSDGANQPQPSRDEVLLERYIQRDLLHAAAMNDQVQKSRELLQQMEHRKEQAARDYERRRHAAPQQQHPPAILYAINRPPPNRRRVRELHISRKDRLQQAEQHEELIPVRIDLELDKLRLRDTFTWNLHEKAITQDQFVNYLLEDLRIPPENLAEVGRHVRAEMEDQVHNYYPHIVVEDGPLEPGRPYFEHKDDEMRIQIKLNITIGRATLIDQFEWDINNPENSPEAFARQMACDNALSGEFTTAIAHSIREQSQLYTKSLYLTNHCFDGRLVEDPELRDGFLSAPIHSAFRAPQAQKDYTPFMYEMSEAELERTETSMLREHRAAKRQLNRRGGPALPDLRDRQRTVRSLIVHSVIPGAVETFETTGILKTRRGGRGRARAGVRIDGDAESEELESDDSGPDSPAPSTLQGGGTARTRGMRGAAAAAQASMRAGYGRSQTPDSQALAPPEPRGGRKSMLREESAADENDQLIVKLKIGRAKFKAWLDEYRAKKRASEYPLSGYASQLQATATPARAVGGGNTPAMVARNLPQAQSTPQPNGGTHRRGLSVGGAQKYHYDARGAVDLDVWPGSDDTPPPPPSWLEADILALHARAPDDDITAQMRPYILVLATGQSVTRTAGVGPGDPAPEGHKIQWQPRIRCHDCEGRWYNVRKGSVVEDFDVHLRNKSHLAAVRKRLAGTS